MASFRVSTCRDQNNIQRVHKHSTCSSKSAKTHGLRGDLSTGTQANLLAECKALRCKTRFGRYQLAKLPGGMGEHRCPWNSPSSTHTTRQRSVQGLCSTSRATGMKTQQISIAWSPLPHHLYEAGGPLVRQQGNTCQNGGLQPTPQPPGCLQAEAGTGEGSPTAPTVALVTHQVCSAPHGRRTDLLWKASMAPICAADPASAVYTTDGSSRNTFC